MTARFSIARMIATTLTVALALGVARWKAGGVAGRMVDPLIDMALLAGIVLVPLILLDWVAMRAEARRVARMKTPSGE